MRIHFQTLLNKDVVKKHKQGQNISTGMTQTRYNNNPEGKRGSLIGEQYPEGLTTGVIQKHER